MIEHLSHFPDGVLAFVCKGRVTKADYGTVHYETAADFTGSDLGAMWDDFSVGMERITRWDRVAVVTDFEWVEHRGRACLDRD
jgi:hypothetical protein